MYFVFSRYESPCLKHDWFDDIIFYVMKNSSKLLYIESLEAMKHAGIFLSLIFFLNWHQISFFPFIRKLTSFENYLKRFQNRLPNKLSNTEINSPISNIWIMVCSSCLSSITFLSLSLFIPMVSFNTPKKQDKRELDDIGQRSLLSLLQLDAATRGVAVRSLKACNFIKKRLLHRCFPVNTAKFSRTFWVTSVNSCFYLVMIGNNGLPFGKKFC